VAITALAVPAYGTSHRNHRQGTKAYPIGAQANHLHYISSRAHAAIAPHLHSLADTRLDQCMMRLYHPYLCWQTDMADEVLTGCPSPTIETAQIDNIGIRLGDTHGDDVAPGTVALNSRAWGWCATINELGQVFNGNIGCWRRDRSVPG
jgi:hypothetical protein